MKAETLLVKITFDDEQAPLYFDVQEVTIEAEKFEVEANFRTTVIRPVKEQK